MFDFVKITIKDDLIAKKLLNNPLLEFTALHKNSGEVINEDDKKSNPRYRYRYAVYNNFRFKVYDNGVVLVKGSLHRYFNDDLNNFSQFSVSDLAIVFEKLLTELSINSVSACVHGLEFGVNICLPFNPNIFISNIISHKGRNFNQMDVADGFGRTSVRSGSPFGIKIYNKSIQFHLDYNVLRFEINISKMECIRKGKIFLIDLLTDEVITKCKSEILNRFNELIIKEPVLLSNLNSSDREFYLKYINPLYHQTVKNKTTKCREKARYKKLIDFYSTDRIKEVVYNLLVKTIDQITSSNTHKYKLLNTDQPIVSKPFDHLDILSISNNHLSINKENSNGQQNDIRHGNKSIPFIQLRALRLKIKLGENSSPKRNLAFAFLKLIKNKLFTFQK